MVMTDVDTTDRLQSTTRLTIIFECSPILEAAAPFGNPKAELDDERDLQWGMGILWSLLPAVIFCLIPPQEHIVIHMLINSYSTN